jgi:hypothetical protein
MSLRKTYPPEQILKTRLGMQVVVQFEDSEA